MEQRESPQSQCRALPTAHPAPKVQLQLSQQSQTGAEHGRKQRHGSAGRASNIAKLLLRGIPEIHAFEEGAGQVCAEPQEKEKPEGSPPHSDILAGAARRSQVAPQMADSVPKISGYGAFFTRLAQRLVRVAINEDCKI